MKLRTTWFLTSISVGVIGLSAPSFAVPIVQQGSGANAAAIQAAVDAFRTDLGNPDNLNAPGPLASGRREINWDGGGATNGTAAVTPFTVFQNTRGATVTTPGIGLTQAPISGGTVDIVPGGGVQGSLADINPAYASVFVTFSPNRLFTPLGSNITNTMFSVPGSGGAEPATVSGFGAVFTDVDFANTTSIQFFNSNGASLGTFFVPTADNGLSFLGVSGFDQGIGGVRITTGNAPLGLDNSIDAVVMDDFIYGEPQTTIPEPSSLLLLGTGLAVLAWARNKVGKQLDAI
jgi:hypothetical protein